MTVSVADKLVELRKKSGLSQEELAEKLGVSRQAISKWERAEASPDTDNLIMLARLYGISLDELLLDRAAAEPADAIDGGRSQSGTHAGDGRDGGSGSRSAEERVRRARFRRLKKVVVPAAVLIYLAVSFITHRWDITWIVFLMLPVIFSIIRLFYIGRPAGAVIPALVTVAYLVLGLAWGLWHPAWIIFLFIPLAYSLWAAIRDRRPDEFEWSVLVTIVFLLLGFQWGLWHPGWLVFLTIPVYDALFPAADQEDDDQEDDGDLEL